MTKVTDAIKTPEYREELIALYNNRANWNKRININGHTFIYISATNEFRMEHNSNGKIHALLIACMTFDRFMWCC